LFGPVEEEARDVTGIDGFDQQLDVLLRKGIRCVAEVFNKHCAKLSRIGTCGGDSRKAVHLAAIECFCIVDSAFDAIAEFSDAIRKYRDAAFARAPVSCWEIMQHLGQPVLLQLLTEHAFFKVVGKQILHTCKPGRLGRREAVKERQLVEKHGQVGCEFRHGGFPFLVAL